MMEQGVKRCANVSAQWLTFSVSYGQPGISMLKRRLGINVGRLAMPGNASNLLSLQVEEQARWG